MENTEKIPFDNADRSRYYGLRVGDIIDAKSPNGRIWGRSEVVAYGAMDNNQVSIYDKHGAVIPWVAEWCDIVQKVEERGIYVVNRGASTDLLEAAQKAYDFLWWLADQKIDMWSNKRQEMYEALEATREAIKKATGK